MKKIVLQIVFIAAFALTINAQAELDDFGRVVLNSYLPEKIALPKEAKEMLMAKLSQIATNNGMGGSQANQQFIITASVNVGTKDIIAGPPQLISQNINITFFVGDAITNTIFSNTTISLKGVGTNENKAMIDALNSINQKNKELLAMLDKGKSKIVLYYNSQCDFILTKSKTLSDQQKYKEAIYELMLVPEVCKTCYDKCMEAVQPIFQKLIDHVCTLKLNEAKTTWAANPNSSGASTVAPLLSEINPYAACYNDALAFSETVRKKVEEDEKRNWDFKMKKYTDGVKLEKQRIEAAKEIAVQYAKNQPKTIVYNRIIW
jgi:hypothetical protein